MRASLKARNHGLLNVAFSELPQKLTYQKLKDKMKIGLIACSKTKLGKDTPEKKFKAQDIYQGNTFKKSKSEGIKLYDCDDWFILSGKEDYNLL